MKTEKTKLIKKNNSNNQKQRGQSLTEYLILVALVAVSSIGIVRMLGNTTSTQLANITRALQGNKPKKLRSEKVEEKHYSKKDMSSFMNNTAD